MRSCMKQLVFLGLITAFGFWGFGLVWADEGPLLGPRTLVVALDGAGDYISLQEAVDAAKKGDTVFVKAGQYHQDVTIHGKEKIRFVGAGVDQVTILGRDIVAFSSSISTGLVSTSIFNPELLNKDVQTTPL